MTSIVEKVAEISLPANHLPLAVCLLINVCAWLVIAAEVGGDLQHQNPTVILWAELSWKCCRTLDFALFESDAATAFATSDIVLALE